MGEKIVLEYSTWGSFGQFARSVAVLVDGQLLDPSKTPHGKGLVVKKVINVGGREYEIVIESRDSNKNSHRYIEVPREIVLAVIKESKSSSGWKGFSIEGEGEIVAEEKQQSWDNGRYRYTKIIREYYYVHKDKGIKIKLREQEVDFKKELIAKPQITIRVEGTIIRIKGDTYHIREHLKNLRYRWDPALGVWYYSARDENEAKNMAEKTYTSLTAVAEVSISD